ASCRPIATACRSLCGVIAREFSRMALPGRRLPRIFDGPEGPSYGETSMKAWRFYGFGGFRLDDIPTPQLPPRHVLGEPLCVQPSVTEAQLAFGIPTLAYDRVKRRLEADAPLQLFGHEFCARIIAVGAGVSRFHVGDRVAARAKLPCERCPLCLSERGH